MAYTPYKAQRMKSPLTQEESQNIAYGIKKSDSVTQNKHNENVNKEMLNFKDKYYKKHGSSSGGSDEEYGAYQDSLKVIRKKYKQ
tara:strand:+ start:558 stop:812 length:255 start_codon:yes stop_codon:yes gene_type:complete